MRFRRSILATRLRVKVAVIDERVFFCRASVAIEVRRHCMFGFHILDVCDIGAAGVVQIIVLQIVHYGLSDH